MVSFIGVVKEQHKYVLPADGYSRENNRLRAQAAAPYDCPAHSAAQPGRTLRPACHDGGPKDSFAQ